MEPQHIVDIEEWLTTVAGNEGLPRLSDSLFSEGAYQPPFSPHQNQGEAAHWANRFLPEENNVTTQPPNTGNGNVVSIAPQLLPLKTLTSTKIPASALLREGGEGEDFNLVNHTIHEENFQHPLHHNIPVSTPSPPNYTAPNKITSNILPNENQTSQASTALATPSAVRTRRPIPSDFSSHLISEPHPTPLEDGKYTNELNADSVVQKISEQSWANFSENQLSNNTLRCDQNSSVTAKLTPFHPQNIPTSVSAHSLSSNFNRQSRSTKRPILRVSKTVSISKMPGKGNEASYHEALPFVEEIPTPQGQEKRLKKAFKCRACHYRGMKINVLRHASAKHVLHFLYSCHFCRMGITTKQNLETHIREQHQRKEASEPIHPASSSPVNFQPHSMTLGDEKDTTQLKGDPAANSRAEASSDVCSEDQSPNNTPRCHQKSTSSANSTPFRQQTIPASAPAHPLSLSAIRRSRSTKLPILRVSKTSFISKKSDEGNELSYRDALQFLEEIPASQGKDKNMKKDFKCTACPYRGMKINVLRHASAKHLLHFLYTCPFCKIGITTNQNLQAHIQRNH